MAADFLMLNCYAKEKRTMYERCKIVETQDYSDLQDRINIVQQSEKNPSALLRRPKNLGIGPGGKGGMPENILAAR